MSEEATPTPDKRPRLQLELHQATSDALERIGASLGINTNAEIIRRAVAYLDLMAKAQKDGERVEIVAANGDRRQLVIL